MHTYATPLSQGFFPWGFFFASSLKKIHTSHTHGRKHKQDLSCSKPGIWIGVCVDILHPQYILIQTRGGCKHSNAVQGRRIVSDFSSVTFHARPWLVTDNSIQSCGSCESCCLRCVLSAHLFTVPSRTHIVTLPDHELSTHIHTRLYHNPIRQICPFNPNDSSYTMAIVTWTDLFVLVEDYNGANREAPSVALQWRSVAVRSTAVCWGKRNWKLVTHWRLQTFHILKYKCKNNHKSISWPVGELNQYNKTH